MFDAIREFGMLSFEFHEFVAGRLVALLGAVDFSLDRLETIDERPCLL